MPSLGWLSSGRTFGSPTKRIRVFKIFSLTCGFAWGLVWDLVCGREGIGRELQRGTVCARALGARGVRLRKLSQGGRGQHPTYQTYQTYGLRLTRSNLRPQTYQIQLTASDLPDQTSRGWAHRCRNSKRLG